MAGKFTWYELLTTDAQAASDFYTTVVGWWGEDAGMEQPYTLVKTTAGDTVGGIMGGSADMLPMGPSWRGYVEVDDVDTSLAKAQGAGATLRYGPMDIPNVGRFAIV